MPLSEVDPNIVRHNSRSSNLSTDYKVSPRSAFPNGSSYVAPAGTDKVFSMLRTTTETGDIGSFSVNPSRLPKLPRGLSRHPQKLPSNLGHSSSRASSHYSRNGSTHGSIRSARSHRSAHDGSVPGAWPYGQYQYSSSQDFPRPTSEARSSIAQESVRSMMLTGNDRFDLSERSHSLTQTMPHPRTFSDNRSLSSLRSQDAVQRPRSPFVQANRLNFPSHRPSSPALSDTAGVFYARRHAGRPRPGPRAHTVLAYPPRSAHDYPYKPAPQHFPQPSHIPHFRPGRTIEDLKRPFIAGNNPSNLRSHEAPAAFRVPQPLPAPPRHADYGPPLPHSRMFAPRTPSQRPQRVPHDPIASPRRGPSDTTPYVGFVQRVKNALEERTSSDELRSVPLARGTSPLPSKQVAGLGPWEASAQEDDLKHESVVDNHVHDAPIDGSLPANHVIPSPSSVKRLTRDMIKAGMDGMSDIVALSEVAEEGMATSILNADEDESSKNVSHESLASLTRNSIELARSVSGSSQANNRENDTQSNNMTDNDSTTGSSDPINFSLSMSRQTMDPPRKSMIVTQLPEVEYVAEESATLKNRTPTNEPAASSKSTRPSSMPTETLPVRARARRNTTAQSMPMPGIYPESPRMSPMNDSDDEQQAIRLSSIEPKMQIPSVDENAHKTYRPSSGHKSSEHVVDSCDTIEQSTKNANSPVPSGTASARSSLSALIDRPSTRPNSEESVEAPTMNSKRSSSLRSAALMDAARQAMSAVSRPSPQPNDPRTSAVKNFHFPLPDLTEDSQEDASTTNLRMLGMRAPNLRPRHPKDFRRPVQPSARAPTPASPPKSYFSRSLVESHNIPSFNFSRVDLTTKLNSALGLRFSRSAEDLTQLSSVSINASMPSRPVSQSMIRETYRSFFAPSPEEAEVDTSHVDRSMVRSMQMDEELMSEIERLSIPSVKHLTARLSELLPSIKQYRSELDLEKVDEALRQTVEEIRQLGSPESSAMVDTGLRANGIEDTSPPFTRQTTLNSRGTALSDRRARRRSLLHLMKELPPLPNEDDYEDAEKRKSLSDQSSSASSDDASNREDISELDGTAVDVTGSTNIREHRKTLSGEVEHNKMSALAANPSPGTTPRPWNKNENYPWTHEEPLVDVTVSAAAKNVEQDEHALPASHSRKRARSSQSGPSIVRHTSMQTVRSMSPGFDAELVPNTERPGCR